MGSVKNAWPGFARMQPIFALIGVAGIGATFALANGQPSLWQSYLLGFVPWMSLVLGCVGLMLLHHLVRGQWSYPVIRLFEAGARSLPLMLVLLIPIILFAKNIYPWADANKVATSEILQGRSTYLNTQFFTIRMLIYFAVWMFATFMVTRWSSQEDNTGDPNLVIKRTNFSAPFMVLFVVCITAFMTDLVMSLEIEWFSTIYGLLWTVSSVLSTLAFATVYLLNVRNKEPFASIIEEKQQWRDMGNLMLTFTILWAYMSFSQFLIIWSGNLPEEIGYFVKRSGDLWTGIGTGLIFLHFLLPFFLLLSSRLKRTPAMLGGTAIFILLIRLVDVIWNVVPSLGRTGALIVLSDVTAFIGVGGLFLAFLIWNLNSRQITPTYMAVSAEEAHDHA